MATQALITDAIFAAALEELASAVGVSVKPKKLRSVIERLDSQADRLGQQAQTKSISAARYARSIGVDVQAAADVMATQNAQISASMRSLATSLRAFL